MRDSFVAELLTLAKSNKNIELVTGDLGFGVLKPFWEALPNQLVNAGIAEQSMTSAAAGMALEGKTVFTYSIGNFPTLRCLEQIRNDCAYHNANVKIVCVGGGFTYGSLGMSHHATEDIAVMRALPGVTVLCPADAHEARAAVRIAASTEGTFYIRLGRGGEENIHSGCEVVKLGKAIKVKSGSRVAIFSTGAVYGEVKKASRLLEKEGISPAVYTFPTVKPIDKDVIEECAANFEIIATVEEHNVFGGFGSAVAEVLCELNRSARLIKIGINDTYSKEVGSQSHLRKFYGIDGESIKKRILEEVDK